MKAESSTLKAASATGRIVSRNASYSLVPPTGKPLEGLTLSDSADPAATFQGALDFSSVTAMG